ncbi:MAG: hypothetical protein WAV47_23075 [Blastocatellia bacterium]
MILSRLAAVSIFDHRGGFVGWNVRLSRLTAVSIFDPSRRLCRLKRETLTPGAVSIFDHRGGFVGLDVNSHA